VQWAGRIAVVFFILFCINFAVMQPLYYSQNNMNDFIKKLKTTASQVKPYAEWKFVMLDPESKMRFYLQLSPEVKNYGPVGDRTIPTKTELLTAWPILKNPPRDTIFISRKLYLPALASILKNNDIIEIEPNYFHRLLKVNDANDIVAFIPQ
jgi:hypothetical protein